MGESISIRPFDLRQDESILAAVHAAHFTGLDSQLKRQSYARWLDANPAEGSIYLAAYVDGKFASFLGFMAREVIAFGRTFRGALAFGAMTLSEFGGRGLYKRLAQVGWEEARRRGFDFAMGYTVRPYVLDMELRMGWSKITAAPVMALPLDVPAVLGAAVPRLRAVMVLAAPFSPLARTVASGRAGRATPAGYSLFEAEGFSAEYDALNERFRTAERLTFAKDRRTLEWLYLSSFNPFEYDIVEARSDGSLVGFAVGRRMDFLGLDGYGILDLIAVPGHDAVLRPMAGRLVSIALKRKSQVVGAMVSDGHPPHAALKSLGFISSRRAFALIYRPTRDALPNVLADPRNWCNYWGNNDTV
ncbi:MAG: GNAT family N-acetyltransferase [Alphaproteobacteria bacterium]|nr:GNAT family N-acetyltransferase [Alphaproteobacteria bacterium]